MTLYDSIGSTYADARRADPRIAARIAAAVGEGTVLSVGGGTGSYEPRGTVLAVEPSAVMIAQRPASAAPALQAFAEALPLPDAAFDVALAVLTLHHWSDLDAGLAELERVARRVVILTWDATHVDRFWLLRDYLPATLAWERRRMPDVEGVAARLGASVDFVPIPHDCEDGFLCSFWRRPAAYLDPTVRAGISYFVQLGEETVSAGLARLADDLASGAWERRYRDLLALDELDVGYRLLTT